MFEDLYRYFVKRSRRLGLSHQRGLTLGCGKQLPFNFSNSNDFIYGPEKYSVAEQRFSEYLEKACQNLTEDIDRKTPLIDKLSTEILLIIIGHVANRVEDTRKAHCVSHDVLKMRLLNKRCNELVLCYLTSPAVPPVMLHLSLRPGAFDMLHCIMVDPHFCSIIKEVFITAHHNRDEHVAVRNESRGLSSAYIKRKDLDSNSIGWPELLKQSMAALSKVEVISLADDGKADCSDVCHVKAKWGFNGLLKVALAAGQISRLSLKLPRSLFEALRFFPFGMHNLEHLSIDVFEGDASRVDYQCDTTAQTTSNIEQKHGVEHAKYVNLVEVTTRAENLKVLSLACQPSSLDEQEICCGYFKDFITDQRWERLEEFSWKGNVCNKVCIQQLVIRHPQLKKVSLKPYACRRQSDQLLLAHDTEKWKAFVQSFINIDCITLFEFDAVGDLNGDGNWTSRKGYRFRVECYGRRGPHEGKPEVRITTRKIPGRCGFRLRSIADSELPALRKFFPQVQACERDEAWEQLKASGAYREHLKQAKEATDGPQPETADSATLNTP